MESYERKAFRQACKWYGVEGNCHKQSHAGHIHGYYLAVDIVCTPNCDCARMRRYDKRKKQE